MERKIEKKKVGFEQLSKEDDTETSQEDSFDGYHDDDEAAKLKWLAMRWKQKQDDLKRKGWLYRFMVSSPDDFVLVKLLWGIPVGVLLGSLIYTFVFSQLNINMAVQFQVAVIFVAVFAASFAWSVAVRCIMFLMIPTAFSNCGRLYLYALMLLLLLQGPIGNFVSNSKEVFRSTLCAVDLLTNQTRMMTTIRIVPLLDMLLLLLENQNDLIRKVHVIKERLTEYVNEVEFPQIPGVDTEVDMKKYDEVVEERRRKTMIKELGVGDKKGTYEKNRERQLRKEEMNRKVYKFLTKLTKACDRLIDTAQGTCNEIFDNVKKTCMLILFIFFFVCWVVDLARRCNVRETISTQFHTSCDDIKKNLKADDLSSPLEDLKLLLENLFSNFDAQYQFQDPNENMLPEPSVPSSQQIHTVLEQNLVFKQLLLSHVTTLLARCMPLLFVLLLYKSHSYLDSYLTQLNFDNIYINSYFVHVDNRRKMLLKQTLLPLKRTEASETIEVFNHRITFKDSMILMRSITWLCSFSFYLLLIYATDILLSNTLLLFSQHAAIQYTHIGKTEITVSVLGEGCLAGILKILTKGFNIKRNIRVKTSNAVCLPVATTGNSDFSFFRLSSLFFLVIALYVVEPYVARYKHLVAGCFFRKRHKDRTLYLYNSLRRRRIAHTHQARHTVRRKIRNNQFTIPIGFMLALRYAFPGYFEWIVKFGFGLQECTICKEPENDSFKHCSTFLCKATYCSSCWVDIGFRCYACKDDDDWSDSSGGDTVLDHLGDVFE